MLLPAVAWLGTRRFLPARSAIPTSRATGSGSGALVAWREPRTLLIGLMVLGFAFTEGSANDWMAIAFVDGYGTGEVGGAARVRRVRGAMTVARLVGGAALERFGRVPVLRVPRGSALAGLLLVLLGGSPAVAVVGALLWGSARRSVSRSG